MLCKICKFSECMSHLEDLLHLPKCEVYNQSTLSKVMYPTMQCAQPSISSAMNKPKAKSTANFNINTLTLLIKLTKNVIKITKMQNKYLLYLQYVCVIQ